MAINFLQDELINLVQDNTDNLPRDLGGIYGTDLTEQELAAGIRPMAEAAGTPTYGIPEFDKYRFASRNQRALPSMYQLYLGGGFPEETTDTAQIPGATDYLMTTGDGGAGDAAQIPGATDFLATVPDADEMTFQDVVDSDANRGFVDAPVDTTMPANLTPDMGADSFIDTTPDYSVLDHSGHPMAKTTPEIPTVAGPFDYLQDEPVNLVERDPMSNPRLSNVIKTRADVTPEIPTVAGPFDYLQDEPVELGPVDPGVTHPRALPLALTRADATTPEVPPSPQLMDPTMMIPQVPKPEEFTEPTVTGYQGEVTADQGFETLPTEEKTNMLQDALSKAQEMGGDLISNFQENLMGTGKFSLPQLGSFIQTVMNPSSWSVAGALGIPGMILGGIGKALGAAGDFLPQGGPTLQTSKAQSIGLVGEGETQDIYGINTQSQFGDYDQYAIDKAEELQTKFDNGDLKQYDDDGNLTYLGEKQAKYAEYNTISGVGGDIQPTGDARAAEEALDLDLQAALDRAQGVETGDAAEAERIAAEDRAAKAEEQAMLEELAREEDERAARVREEAAQRDSEAAAERAAAEQEAAAAQAAKIEAARRALQVINAPQVGSGQDGGYTAPSDRGGYSDWGYSPFRKGGRVGYGKGGIVDLLK